MHCFYGVVWCSYVGISKLLLGKDKNETDKELDEMIELYKGQIEEKKNKLKNYRMKLAAN